MMDFSVFINRQSKRVKLKLVSIQKLDSFRKVKEDDDYNHRNTV